MSDQKQNRPQGRIPARAMYEKMEQVPPPPGDRQDLTRRGDRVRTMAGGEPEQRYVPAPPQYVSKRVSRSPEEFGSVPQASPSGQMQTRHRRSDRHTADRPEMDGEPASPRMAAPTPRQVSPMRPPMDNGNVRPPMDNGNVRPPMDNGPLVGQGRPQAPGANYARSPRQGEFAPARVRPPQPVPAYLEEEEEEAPRRGHTGLIVLLSLVLVAGLFVAGLYFVLPADIAEGDNQIIKTLGGIRASITKEVEWFSKSVKGILSPEVKEPAQVQDFQVVPSSGQAPVELAITVTTTKSVEGVRVLDAQGNILAQQETPRVKEERIIWALTLSLKDAYSGLMSAQMMFEGNWMDSGRTVQVNIAAPVVAPAATPDAPVQTPPSATDAPAIQQTEAPIETPASTPEPTEAPTPSPAPSPTPSPTPTPSPEPTPSPTPGPTPMPYMAAGAVAGTDPTQLKLASKAYDGTKAVSEFTRVVPIKMGGPADYAAWQGAVLTFRSGPFRQNAAFGTVNVAENKLEIAWNTPMGGISTYYGAGWTGQPAIVKWAKEVREMMNLTEEKKAVTALKEVILASQDGKIYFLDLNDGQPTRDPINVGYPLKGSVSIDPRGMPLLSVGQGVSKIGGKTGEIGFFLFNLINQKQIHFQNGRDKNAYGTNGAFDGTSLTDRNSDTMIICGENGMLYTLYLNSKFDLAAGTLTISPKVASYKALASKQKNTETGIEGSVAMYGNYAYFADATGILQCVDTNTMKPVWAVDTDDNTDASIALDFDEDGALALYTGNTLKEQGKKGVCTIRRLNALTGEQEWSYPVNVDYNTTEWGGVMASPIIGQQSIGNLVIFTVAKTAEGGAIIAFDKKTGHVVWQQNMPHFSWSSPVAVYNESGDAWILQGDNEGVLMLLDGETGAVQDSIQLEGAITGSPAVYNDMLVVGTSGKGVSKIYGVKIK